MCDTERRCDKPSCPCNEPDTELKDALERMRERFPAPWVCDIVEIIDDWFLAKASIGDNDVVAQVFGPGPHAAVDAAIKAWDAAVKADALYVLLGKACPEQLAALNTLADSYEACRAHVALLKAEVEAARANDAAYLFCEHGIGKEHTEDQWADATDVLKAARAAVDKAGVLNG